ncbi:MAG: ribokinase [Planctomycetia bacterium]|nr:ribokinase [Planctomycetia bacterium]
MPILNFGSLNIDRVLRVGHIARPGETIAGTSLGVFAGGKGANQSVALARAGAQVAHAGKIGADGAWLLEKLSEEKVDTRWARVDGGTTGQAMIQVDDAGQNAIVLLAGANREIAPNEIDEALADFPAESWFLVQNETSSVGHAIQSAKARGMRVALNPAPFDSQVLEYPLDQVDLLCVNESEGAAMTGANAPRVIVAELAARLPKCEILLTLGSAGVLYRGASGPIHLAAPQVQAVDTTAAGDTFLGYFLAGRCGELGLRESLELACRAAALCVTRPGAMDSIPRLDEVLAFRGCRPAG